MQEREIDYTTQIFSIIDSGKFALRCFGDEKSELKRQAIAGKFFQTTLTKIRKVPAKVLNLGEISELH